MRCAPATDAVSTQSVASVRHRANATRAPSATKQLPKEPAFTPAALALATTGRRRLRGLDEGLRELGRRLIAVVRISLHRLEQHLLYLLGEFQLGTRFAQRRGIAAQPRDHHLLLR